MTFPSETVLPSEFEEAEGVVACSVSADLPSEGFSVFFACVDSVLESFDETASPDSADSAFSPDLSDSVFSPSTGFAASGS